MREVKIGWTTESVGPTPLSTSKISEKTLDQTYSRTLSSMLTWHHCFSAFCMRGYLFVPSAVRVRHGWDLPALKTLERNLLIRRGGSWCRWSNWFQPTTADVEITVLVCARDACSCPLIGSWCKLSAQAMRTKSPFSDRTVLPEEQLLFKCNKKIFF